METWKYGEWKYWPDIDEDTDIKEIGHYAVRIRRFERDLVPLQGDPYTWMTEDEFKYQVDLQIASSPFHL